MNYFCVLCILLFLSTSEALFYLPACMQGMHVRAQLFVAVICWSCACVFAELHFRRSIKMCLNAAAEGVTVATASAYPH